MEKDCEDCDAVLQKLKQQPVGCAATLTYRVAPFPSDEDLNTQLTLALLAESDKQIAASVQASTAGRWLTRAWEGVKSFAHENVVAMRQTDFLRHFSRQLESNAEEMEVAMMSARCSLVSMAEPVPGLLFVTNWGWYFVSDEAAAADGVADRADTTTSAAAAARRRRLGASAYQQRSPQSTPPPLPAVSPTQALPLTTSGKGIKERVDFSRVASMLACVTREERVPVSSTSCGSNATESQTYLHFEGIPSAQVQPTALELFTVSPHQIYQFVSLSYVVIKPPAIVATAPSVAAGGSGAEVGGGGDPQGSPTMAEPTSRVRNPVVSPAFIDVIKPTEFDLLKSMPVNLDTFKTMVIMWRLWRLRLESLKQPLLNPLATYAEPH